MGSCQRSVMMMQEGWKYWKIFWNLFTLHALLLAKVRFPFVDTLRSTFSTKRNHNLDQSWLACPLFPVLHTRFTEMCELLKQTHVITWVLVVRQVSEHSISSRKSFKRLSTSPTLAKAQQQQTSHKKLQPICEGMQLCKPWASFRTPRPEGCRVGAWGDRVGCHYCEGTCHSLLLRQVWKRKKRITSNPIRWDKDGN